MRRQKYRIGLCILLLSVIAVGLVYYFYFLQGDTVITEGTLVFNNGIEVLHP